MRGLDLITGAVLVLGAPLALLGCEDEGRAEAIGRPTTNPELGLTVSSESFAQGGAIPARHTCDGEDESPPLGFTDIPENTASLALVVTNPDAPHGTFTHWVIWNLPVARDLGGAIPREGSLPSGARQGQNDFDRTGYGGPCPPPGPAHHYVFRAYALDRMLDLPPSATRRVLEGAMQGHEVGRGQLTGTYARASER